MTKWLVLLARTVGLNIRLLATWFAMPRLGTALPAGTILRVRRPLTLVLATHWKAPFTDAIEATLPDGTELVTAHAVSARSRGVQCFPRDRSALESLVVPADVRDDPRLSGISMALRASELEACEVVGQAAGE